MSAHADTAGSPCRGSGKRAGDDPAVVAQLQCIHIALRVKLATAAQISEGESYEATLLRLSREINVLATNFLELSEKLLADDGAAGAVDSTD
jgi:hypothetical protein